MTQTEDIRELKERIKELIELINSVTFNPELYFVSSYNKKNTLSQGVLGKATRNVFNEILKSSLNKYIDAFKTESLIFREYNSITQEDADNDTDSTLDYIKAKDGEIYPEIPQFESFIPLTNRAYLPLFDLEARSKFWAYIIRIPTGDDDSAVYLFNKASEGNIIGEKKYLFNFKDREYNKVDDKALLLYKTTDCIFIKDTLFILNSTKFESIFRYKEQYIKNINTKLPKLKNCNLVDNTDKLLDFCNNDTRRIKHLDRVLRKEKYVSLDTNKIADLISKYNLKINLVDGKMEITKDNLSHVLTVLEDYFVETYFNNTRMIMKTGTDIQK